jgi:quercetin dioxygenase-like cupin family protein
MIQRLIPFVVAVAAPLAAAQAIVKPAAELAWIGAGVSGVSTAAVEGDLVRGASRFYLRYAAGFSAPPHYHSADHFVTTVTGNLVLIINGKEHRLAPGSYFSLRDKALHAARCEGTQDCVMFIEARSPWDVVAAK